YSPTFSLHISTIFLYNAPPPTQIYTLSLHDALPISRRSRGRRNARTARFPARPRVRRGAGFSVQSSGAARQNRRRAAIGLGSDLDRKSTRLNSSHRTISYAVFCLKKKKKKNGK